MNRIPTRTRWPLPALGLAVLALACPTVRASDVPPPIPAEVPVLLVGHPGVNGSGLVAHRTDLSVGPARKDGPLKYGEKIKAQAVQTTILERVVEGGTEVLRRTTKVRRPGEKEVLTWASIDMDPRTLRPIRARTEQGGQTTTLDYDWEDYVVRRTPSGEAGREHDEISLDMAMHEVGAHDVWMAALPLSEGFTARLPAVFGATGTKYWAVPRVVGSEAIDLGDGKRHPAWVVELDWWGMGADNTVENHSTGGGVNGTAGPGGKYWVLKKPVDGRPRVVRVRTEVTPAVDSVIQVQGP